MEDAAFSSDVVRRFYEAWPHPAQPPNLDEFRDFRRVPRGSAASSFFFYWPNQSFSTDLDILYAGCGTTQAVESSLWDNKTRSVAIDVSQACIDRTAALANRYNITNLDLHRLPIEEVASLGRQFDLIFCTGVLHHLQDPDAGLRALREVLRPSGSMCLMVYGKAGRAGVYMFQEYCRRLGYQPTQQDIAELSQMMTHVGEDHPIGPFYRRREDFNSPEGLADVLLNPRDRAYSVPDIYNWIDRCGMRMQRWFYQAMYLPQCSALAGTPHQARLQKLPDRDQHAAIELFRGHLDKHSFIACRDDRPESSWRTSLADPDWQNLIPVPQFTFGLREVTDRPGYVGKIVCSGHELPVADLLITPADYSLLQWMDGNRTLGQIASASTVPNNLAHTREFFQRLWDFDQIMLRRLPAGS